MFADYSVVDRCLAKQGRIERCLQEFDKRTPTFHLLNRAWWHVQFQMEKKQDASDYEASVQP